MVREGGEEWIEVVAYWWLRFLPWWWGLCGCCGRVFGDHSWEGSCSFACLALNVDGDCTDGGDDNDGEDGDDDDDDYLPPGRHPPEG